MMETNRMPRYLSIAVILLLGICWSFASARPAGDSGYPNDQFHITANELMEKMGKEPLVIVDVRNDKDFDGKMIPGAIRLPWTAFRTDSPADNMGGLFVGPQEAQDILGAAGLFRNDQLILYDSLEHDGGATASYVFWVLDLLGHKRMAILERGLDGWLAAGGEIVNKPDEREPLLYQAPRGEIRLRRLGDGEFIFARLGDPYYQFLDVRSRAEYLGETLNTALDDSPLKAGHIPGADNINYEDNWRDPESKALKSPAELASLYRNISPDKAVITYCHSGRRSSYSYYVLRLLGFEDVILYDKSWFDWGHPEHYYPVATAGGSPGGQPASSTGSAADKQARQPSNRAAPPDRQSPSRAVEKDESGGGKGYISCGG